MHCISATSHTHTQFSNSRHCVTNIASQHLRDLRISPATPAIHVTQGYTRHSLAPVSLPTIRRRARTRHIDLQYKRLLAVEEKLYHKPKDKRRRAQLRQAHATFNNHERYLEHEEASDQEEAIIVGTTKGARRPTPIVHRSHLPLSVRTEESRDRHDGARRTFRDSSRLGCSGAREVLLAGPPTEHLDDCYAGNSRNDIRGKRTIYGNTRSDGPWNAMVRTPSSSPYSSLPKLPNSILMLPSLHAE